MPRAGRSVALAFLCAIPPVFGVVPAGAAPTLFYMTKAKGGPCVWMTLDVGDAAGPRPYLTTPDCPAHVVFDAAGKTTSYTLGDDLMRQAWGSGKPPQRVAELPGAYPGGMPEVDARLVAVGAPATLRFAYLAPLDEKDAKTKDGRKVYESGGRAYDAEAFGIVGMPHLAHVLELQQDGKWKALDPVPTNWAAGETLGFLAVAKQLEEAAGAPSLGALEHSDASFEQVERETLPAPLQKKLTAALGAPQEGLAKLAWGAGHALWSNLVWGDAPHMSTPFAACEAPACVEPRRLEGLQAGELMAVRKSGAHLLVLPETLIGAAPLVIYKAPETKPARTIDAVVRAVWLPDPVAAGLAP